MNMLSEDEGRYLLGLARKAITAYLEDGKVLEVEPSDVPKSLTENGACFTTLYEKGELRGCIGTLEAHRPLAFDVVDNIISAAIKDPRFYPVTKEELPDLSIEISVLTKPERLDVDGPQELLEALVPGKHGLIIQKGVAKATFLPLVWKKLPKKEDFLSQLCMKAGMLPDSWKQPGVSFFIYEAQEFSE